MHGQTKILSPFSLLLKVFLRFKFCEKKNKTAKTRKKFDKPIGKQRRDRMPLYFYAIKIWKIIQVKRKRDNLKANVKIQEERGRINPPAFKFHPFLSSH